MLIPHFRIYHPDYESGDLDYSPLGWSYNHARDRIVLERQFESRKINSHAFKGLSNCEEYATERPHKIPLKNGRVECFYDFTFYHDQCVSGKIVYKCYPNNNAFTYAEVVRQLTYKAPVEKSAITLDGFEYLSTNYLTYEKTLKGVNVLCVADTSQIPWVIVYETSLEELKYYPDIDYKYNNNRCDRIRDC